MLRLLSDRHHEYYLAFEVITASNRHVFDSFDCAIHKLAPICVLLVVPCEFKKAAQALGAQLGVRGPPDIFLAWGKVRLAVWTHKIDGL